MMLSIRSSSSRVALALAAVATLSGCAVAERYCDRSQLAAESSHTSHPSAGWPNGPSNEEDSLDVVGLKGRCERGRVYIETGLGYKLRDGGFYGPEDVFTINAGVVLWNNSSSNR